MSNVALIAKLTAQEGMRDQLVEALRAGIANAESEPGTLRYIMHTDASDPNLVWFYEMYADQDALVAHGGSEAMKEIGKATRPFAAARPELIFLTPVAGKGL